MFSLESPHGGDSNEYTQYSIFNIKRKSPYIIPDLQLRDFFQWTRERIRKSRGKRAINARTMKTISCTNAREFPTYNIPNQKKKKKKLQKKQKLKNSEKQYSFKLHWIARLLAYSCVRKTRPTKKNGIIFGKLYTCTSTPSQLTSQKMIQSAL